MKKTISLVLMTLMGMVGTYAFAGSDREDTIDRMQKSVEVLQSIMSTPDKGIPEEVLSGAKCIVVVPNLIKGGFIFGGKHGRGVASLGIADRRRRRGPGYAGHERPWFAAPAFEQV